jgi:hypothetical protein
MKRPALYTQSSEEISRAIAPRGTWSRTSNPGPPVPPTLARETGDPLRAEIFLLAPQCGHAACTWK